MNRRILKILILLSLLLICVIANAVNANAQESVITESTEKLVTTIQHVRSLGYVIGLGLVVVGGIIYGVSSLTTSLDPAQSVHGRGIGMKIVFAGIIVVIICAIAPRVACDVARWFNQEPAICQIV